MGVIGYGEGGLLALYNAAADVRMDAAAVCGYFQPREALSAEPIYRNVFGLLEQFGDAELAGLIAPRALCIEACDHPAIDGPPTPREGRQGTAPGVIRTHPFAVVEAEFTRALDLVAQLKAAPFLSLTQSPDGHPGSDELLQRFLLDLGTTKNSRRLKKHPPPISKTSTRKRGCSVNLLNCWSTPNTPCARPNSSAAISSPKPTPATWHPGKNRTSPTAATFGKKSSASCPNRA